MNILVLANPYLVKPLRKMGHNALNANFRENSDLPVSHPCLWKNLEERLAAHSFSPDLVFYADNGNLPFLIDPENIPAPSIFYSIDTYCNPWQVPYAQAFDLAYVAQKDFLPLFLKEGQDARWFPVFCQSGDFGEMEAERNIPVSFVGTIGHKNNPHRAEFLNDFNKCLPLHISSGDFRPVFAASKIALNQTAFGEINFRCFEAMALGAALLMEKCENGFLDIFTPGENILPPFARNNAQEAAKVASIYLRRPDALAKIAENGRQLAINLHSDSARAKTLLNDAELMLRDNIAAKRLNEQEKRGIFPRTAFAMIASELGENMEKHREFFLNMAGRRH